MARHDYRRPITQYKEDYISTGKWIPLYTAYDSGIISLFGLGLAAAKFQEPIRRHFLFAIIDCFDHSLFVHDSVGTLYT